MRYKPKVPPLQRGRRRLRLVFEEAAPGVVTRRWVAATPSSVDLAPAVREAMREALASFDDDLARLADGRQVSKLRTAASRSLSKQLSSIGGECVSGPRLVIWSMAAHGYALRLEMAPKVRHTWTVERPSTGSRMRFEVAVVRGDDLAAVGEAIDDLSLWMATERWGRLMRLLRDGYRKIVQHV